MNTDIFIKYDTPQRTEKFKKQLIQLRGHQCECCKNFQWLDLPINLELHHKDGDKSNNRLDNLEIVSIDENNRRAFCNGLLKYQKRIKTPIYLIDDNDNILKEYDSINQAKNDLNICSSGHISDMLNGKRKTVEGYRFKAKPVSTRDVIVSQGYY